MLQDLKYGLRSLLQSPGLAVVAITSIALGMGLNLCVFGIFEGMFIRGVTATDPPHTFHLWIGGSNRSSYPTFKDLRESKAVADMAGYTIMQFSLGERDIGRIIYGQAITGDYFEMLGVNALLGRHFTADETKPELGMQVAILSYPFWQQEFQGRRDVLGQELKLNGKPFIVVGVLPPGYRSIHGFGLEPPFYVPYSVALDSTYQHRDSFGLELVIRAYANQNKQQATAALVAAVRNIERLQPDLHPHFAGVRVFGVSIFDQLEGQGPAKNVLAFFAMLTALVGLILLMACANVAGLLLSHAAKRRREVSVRLAMGASRFRIIRLFLAEGLMLSMCGLLASASLYGEALNALSRLSLPVEVPFYINPDINWPMALYSALLTVATGVFCSLGPAMGAARANVSAGLKEAIARGTRARFFSFRNNLVIAQVAGSLVLLMASLLFVRSLRDIQTVDPGFNIKNQLIANIHLDGPSPTDERKIQFTQQIIERVRDVPGVQSISASAIVPVSGNSWITSVRIGSDASNQPLVQADAVGPHFFETMGIRLLAGRDFDGKDINGARNVAVVNRAFVKQHFGGRNPLGQIVTVPVEKIRQPVTWQLVGVVDDSKHVYLGEAPTPVIYRSLMQEMLPLMPNIQVRTKGAALALASSVRKAISDAAPGSSVAVKTMEENIKLSIYPNKLAAALLGSMGALGLVLATIGLYAVVAYAVAQRTREIGIRVALGASRTQVLSTVLYHASAMVGIGVVIGLAIASVGVRPLRSFLSASVSLQDPTIIASVLLVLGAAAILAAVVPARRALSVDPIEALRYE